MWQGFSFVAPGMEVHFELAPAMVDRSGGDGGAVLGATDLEGEFVRTAAEKDVEESLVAELAEFSMEAARAVEIVDGDAM
ncbi:Serine/threonine protein kinase [Gracilaria domingensis]|nr:Serine/threonine protein kinase [Gracilaria domingensis]